MNKKIKYIKLNNEKGGFKGTLGSFIKLIFLILI